MARASTAQRQGSASGDGSLGPQAVRKRPAAALRRGAVVVLGPAARRQRSTMPSDGGRAIDNEPDAPSRRRRERASTRAERCARALQRCSAVGIAQTARCAKESTRAERADQTRQTLPAVCCSSRTSARMIRGLNGSHGRAAKWRRSIPFTRSQPFIERRPRCDASIQEWAGPNAKSPRLDPQSLGRLLLAPLRALAALGLCPMRLLTLAELVAIERLRDQHQPIESATD